MNLDDIIIERPVLEIMLKARRSKIQIVNGLKPTDNQSFAGRTCGYHYI